MPVQLELPPGTQYYVSQGKLHLIYEGNCVSLPVTTFRSIYQKLLPEGRPRPTIPSRSNRPTAKPSPWLEGVVDSIIKGADKKLAAPPKSESDLLQKAREVLTKATRPFTRNDLEKELRCQSAKVTGVISTLAAEGFIRRVRRHWVAASKPQSHEEVDPIREGLLAALDFHRPLTLKELLAQLKVSSEELIPRVRELEKRKLIFNRNRKGWVISPSGLIPNLQFVIGQKVMSRKEIYAALTRMGWLPPKSDDPLPYVQYTLSKNSGIFLRVPGQRGYYQLSPDNPFAQSEETAREALLSSKDPSRE